MTSEAADPDVVASAAALVGTAASVVVLTGAGISTDAGIPDFRGPNGVWTRNPGAERMATLRNYLEEADVRRAAWRSRLDSPVWGAVPTPAHYALVELERSGRLHTLVTQNTDGLHGLAGSSPERVVEVHGTAHVCVCWTCGHRQPTLRVLERVRAGEEDPRCRRPTASVNGASRRGDAELCGGILKTATVSFGQSLDPDDIERAQMAVASAQLLLAVGTTLEVQPIAGIVPLARHLSKAVVIVNGSPTACDDLADVVVRGPISDVLPRLLG
ncbi:MAG: Sir2 family NAD-dependent protein deacetylase [Acidimicrobiales bacterium]|jgi:NAD-dependent deacetylase